MKICRRGVVCIAALLTLAGLTPASTASLAEIKAKGAMTVATEDDYKPFEFVVDGKPMGLDHALLDLLRKQAPFKIEQMGYSVLIS